MARPTQALIDRQALRGNFAIAQAASTAHCMPMVKANAYGHGAEIVCRALDNAPAFGVASIEEALELRRLGVDKPILLLEGTFSADEITLAEENQLWLMVENHQQCRELLEAGIIILFLFQVKILLNHRHLDVEGGVIRVIVVRDQAVLAKGLVSSAIQV